MLRWEEGGRQPGSPLPLGPRKNLLSPFSGTQGKSCPPGVWPCGSGTVAGNEGCMVLGALKAVQLGSPEAGLGWAGSRHMQPLLHLDPGKGTEAQCVKLGAEPRTE